MDAARLDRADRCQTYVQHDPRSNGSEQIIIEPAIDQLDPKWTNAWEQRAKLLIVRAANGEPMGEG
jgi:hypothetical protein